MPSEEERRATARAEEQRRFRSKWGDVPFHMEDGQPYNNATGEPMFIDEEPYVALDKLVSAGDTPYVITNRRTDELHCVGWVRDFIPTEWPEVSVHALKFQAMGFALGVYLYDDDYYKIPLKQELERRGRWKNPTTMERMTALIASDGLDRVYFDVRLIDSPSKEDLSSIQTFEDIAKGLGKPTDDPEVLMTKLKQVGAAWDAYYRKLGLSPDRNRKPGSAFRTASEAP